MYPGYGFLSENTMFVAELEKAGVKFIGNCPIIQFRKSEYYRYRMKFSVQS